ncbi:MAG: histidine phosphatase family protein [Myxococcota bacterium]
MSIFLIRHGETPGNAARIVQTPDTPLSERGIAQAERLARRLAAEGLGGILASDLERAKMTAERLQAACGVPVAHDPLLQERNFGAVRGTAYADLGFDLFAPDYVPPEGEGWPAFHERVTAAWRRIRDVAAATPGPLAVVTHGLVCFSLVQHHFEVAAGVEAPVRFGNTSLTVVEDVPPWTVTRLDCTAHLEGDAADDVRSSL